MFLRTSSLAAIVLLSGCEENSTIAKQVAEAPEARRVACVIGTGAMAKSCAIERDGAAITIRHTDGSFRRFEIDATGHFGAADGADEVSGTRAADGHVDVSIGDRRYRFAPGQLTP